MQQDWMSATPMRMNRLAGGFGGGFGQPQQGGGYDSSGINPGGHFGGHYGAPFPPFDLPRAGVPQQRQQPQFTRNPGGFMPMNMLVGWR